MPVRPSPPDSGGLGIFPSAFLSRLFLYGLATWLFLGSSPFAFAQADVADRIEEERSRLRLLENGRLELAEALERIADKEERIKATLEFLLENETKIGLELKDLNAEMEANLAEINLLLRQIPRDEAKLQALRKSMLEQTRRLFRLKEIKEMSPAPSFRFLVDFRKNVFLLGRIARLESKVFQTFVQLLKRKENRARRLRTHREKLAELKEEKRERYEELVFDQSQQKVYLDYLVREKERNRQDLNQIENLFEDVGDAIERLKTEQAELERLKSEEASILRGFQPHLGKLKRPLEGNLFKRFGPSDSAGRSGIYDQGVLVAPSNERSVPVAILPGKVAFEGFVKGFAEVVIIDHGGSSFAVYGLLKEAFVKKGERVVAGVRIGSLFTSGNGNADDGKRLFYFEMNIRNRPVNPLEWLEKPYAINGE